ncbi:hypothetical protein TRIUR3_33360 [Triticum urartu]|uniref:Uncharacterized protein n=1 Tax=Triticum urartu TaxID=4572 RepID=M7YAS2_TRIUA|nr:hypothetical protein TRIUR3_33360 [Triticum urartu]
MAAGMAYVLELGRRDGVWAGSSFAKMGTGWERDVSAITSFLDISFGRQMALMP